MSIKCLDTKRKEVLKALVSVSVSNKIVPILFVYAPLLAWCTRSLGGVPQGWSDQPSFYRCPLRLIILPGGNVVHWMI